MNTTLFPAFLKLAGRRVVLIGGGGVANVKLRGLTPGRSSSMPSMIRRTPRYIWRVLCLISGGGTLRRLKVR